MKPIKHRIQAVGRRWVVRVAFAIGLMGPQAGAGAGVELAPPRELRVAATIEPLCQLVSEIAGFRVSCLIPNGANPHHYEPKPSEIARSRSAQLIFFVAQSFDGWVTKNELGNQIRVELAMALSPETRVKAGPSIDPHFWTDPLALKELLPLIAQKLCELEPSRCETFKAGQQTTGKRLEEIHQRITELLKTEVKKNGEQPKGLLVSHPFLSYFLKRYSLTQVQFIEESDHIPVSARRLHEVLGWGKAHRVTTILVAPEHPQNQATSLSQHLKAEVVNIDLLGAKDNSWSDTLWQNAQIIKRALK